MRDIKDMENEDPAEYWLQTHWDAVCRDYPDQWVAASKDGIIACGEKLDEVMGALDCENLSPDAFTIHHMPPA